MYLWALPYKAVHRQSLHLTLAVDILTLWTYHAPPAKPLSTTLKLLRLIQILQTPQLLYPTDQQQLKAIWQSMMSVYQMRMLKHVYPSSLFFW